MLGGRRVVVTILVLFLLLFNTDVYAQYGYGLPAKRIDVEKFVGKRIVTKGGTSEEFVENLSSSDPRFRPGEEVRFKIVVRNTSDITLRDVQVVDFVPDFLDFVEGPGNFDQNARKLSFSAGDLAVNEEKTFFFKMRVFSQDRLPADRGVMCVVNKVEVSAEGVSDIDTSQLCIEKEVVGAAEVPAAGPEAGLALLAISTFAAGAGIWLKNYRR